MKVLKTILDISLGLVFSAGSLAWASPEKVILDVIRLEFKAPYVDGKRKSEKYFGSLEMNADMQANKIKRLNVRVGMVGFGDLYNYSVDLSDIRGKTIALKTQGIALGELQGTQLTPDGEGTLKFTPRSSIIGQGLPKSIEITLKRVGAKQKWVVLYQNRVLQKVVFVADKDPSKMNTWSLMMATPKLIKMSIENLGCDSNSVSAVLMDYQAPELLKLSKCDFKNLSVSDIAQIVGDLALRTSVYDNYYLKGIAADVSKAQLNWALEALKSFNFDISKLGGLVDSDEEKGSDLLKDLASVGHEDMLNELLAAGTKPTNAKILENAVQSLYQYDSKTGKVVESATARRIYNTLAAYFPEAHPNAANILLTFLDYLSPSTVRSYADQKSDFSPYPEYTRLLIQEMIQQEFDFKSAETEFNRLRAKEIISSHIEGDEEDTELVYFSKAQGTALLELVKAAK